MNLVKWQDTKSIYRKSVAFLYINTNYQKEDLLFLETGALLLYKKIE